MFPEEIGSFCGRTIAHGARKMLSVWAFSFRDREDDLILISEVHYEMAHAYVGTRYVFCCSRPPSEAVIYSYIII